MRSDQDVIEPAQHRTELFRDRCPLSFCRLKKNLHFAALVGRDATLKTSAVALGGDINTLTPEEGAKADAVNFVVLDRIWNLWKMRIAPSLAK